MNSFRINDESIAQFWFFFFFDEMKIMEFLFRKCIESTHCVWLTYPNAKTFNWNNGQRSQKSDNDANNEGSWNYCES